MKLSGEVKGGRLIIPPASLAIALRQYEGRRVVIEIEPERVQRSLRQNAYYRACVVPVIAHLLTEEMRKVEGCEEAEAVSNEEAHEALKKRFLGREVIAGLDVVRSTTRLSTGGMTDYIERCRMFAAEAGYFIPQPGEREEGIA